MEGAEPSGRMEISKFARRCSAKHISNQNAKKPSVSDHFWKLRCGKSAGARGSSHISKSKWAKLVRSGALLGVGTLKKCTQLWREAPFEVKMLKTHQVLARNAFATQKC